MEKKSRIYTKTGDTGETSLLGSRVKKTHQRIVAYGTVDELNSSLGLVLAFAGSATFQKIILEIQNELFNIGSELATVKTTSQTIKPLLEEKVIWLEKQIDLVDAKLKPLTYFILPGGSRASALLHQARTICRRAEREVIKLGEKEKINPVVGKYLNRLSDLLFVLARATNDKKEIPWKK